MSISPSKRAALATPRTTFDQRTGRERSQEGSPLRPAPALPSLVNLKEAIDDNRDLAAILIDQLLSTIDNDEACVDVQAYLTALRGRAAFAFDGGNSMDYENVRTFVYEVALRMFQGDAAYLDYVGDEVMPIELVLVEERKVLYDVKYNATTRKPIPSTGRLAVKHFGAVCRYFKLNERRRVAWVAAIDWLLKCHERWADIIDKGRQTASHAGYSELAVVLAEEYATRVRGSPEDRLLLGPTELMELREKVQASYNVRLLLSDTDSEEIAPIHALLNTGFALVQEWEGVTEPHADGTYVLRYSAIRKIRTLLDKETFEIPEWLQNWMDEDNRDPKTTVWFFAFLDAETEDGDLEPAWQFASNPLDDYPLLPVYTLLPSPSSPGYEPTSPGWNPTEPTYSEAED